MSRKRNASTFNLFFALALALSSLLAQAQPNPARENPPETVASPDGGNLLLLEVQIDQMTVASSLTAYQVGKTFFLPLGELASILQIAIRAEPQTGKAFGFILRGERNFELDVGASRLIISDQSVPFEPSRVRLQSEDIYVDASLLEDWWPIKLNFDLSLLRLTVQSTEMLPLQLRLTRERAAATLGFNQPTATELPRLDTPYRLIDTPFVDQTLTFNRNQNKGQSSRSLTSSTFLSADFGGFEGAAYFNYRLDDDKPGDLRLTLGRNSPAGQLLGPLAATQFSFGNVVTPGVNHITRTQANGTGLFVSNAPLSRASSFDTTSFTGSLQPGWDVELYFNDALNGYQQSRADGTYSFTDQPLVFGENNYRLVFHGPQGQIRVETRTLMLDASILRPGELLYSLGAQLDEAGQQTTTTQFEYGLNKKLSFVAGMVSVPPVNNSAQARHFNMGLRAYLNAFILTGDYAHAEQQNGNLYALGLNTRINQVAVWANIVRLDNFVSSYYPTSADPLQLSTKLRLDGVLPLGKRWAIPLTFQVQQDQLQSGAENIYLSARATAFVAGTAVTGELADQSLAGSRSLLGNLQVSRNIAQMSVRGQLAYTLEPNTQINNGSLAADFPFANNYLMNLSASREFSMQSNSYSLNLNRNFSNFSVRGGINYDTLGGYTLGLQLFTSLGHDPRANQWLFNVQPTANTGAVAARVFVDYNQNGAFDTGDEPLKGVSLLVNNRNTPAKTGANGLIYLNHLEPGRDAAIELNTRTLEDAQWMPLKPGVSIVPRPGRVVSLDFPVVMTTDIDGTVQLAKNNLKRGVGDVLLELTDANGALVHTARSSFDGYYFIPGVKPGRYKMHVSPEQTRKLRLQPVEPQSVTIHPNGAFIKPVDFLLKPADDPG